MGKLFGTDGIRGKANTYPMTADIALKIGQAAAKTFRNKKKRARILIGKDTRVSGYMIEYALTSGICSKGVDVLLVGPMPTPAIAHLTKSFAADCGIVISASHNSYEDNGIKFFGPDGFKLDDEKEKEIEGLALNNDFDTSNFSGEKIGKAYRIDDAAGRYIEFAKSSIRNKSLEGLKIVIDTANGAAYKIAPMIFDELGAEVIVVNNRPNGININKKCGATYPETIKHAVSQVKADVGIALDGDADRVIMVDENGEELDGDHIIAIAADYFKKKNRLIGNTVVSTVMSNLGLRKFLEEKDIGYVETKVGDRYVVEEMRKNGQVIGGEQSGHIIFSKYTTTGDGTITALQILNIMKKEDKKLSDLRKKLIKYPQVLKNVKVDNKVPLEEIEKLQLKIKEFEKKLGDEGRMLIRYSGTENLCRVMIEGKDEKEIEEMCDSLCKIIEEETR
ncbi:phosphoglucosamine mutase [Candidatus Woesearchaeota archaeon]|nr:MAG: phosphoglucosamine mutase [Candidatus Woesearchaeota archaeon]